MPIRRLDYRYPQTPDGIKLAVDSHALSDCRLYLFDDRPEPLSAFGDPAGASRIGALAAVFDLSGFTSFCDSADFALRARKFLHAFLVWLFEQVVYSARRTVHGDDTLLWYRLPVWEKFTGDGVLFLWEVSDDEGSGLQGDPEVGNILVRLHRICETYQREFLPKIQEEYHWRRIPAQLRCGAARGDVVPIGTAPDFVGNCINMASRLQKVDGYSLVCDAESISRTKCFSGEFADYFDVFEQEVRGSRESRTVFGKSLAPSA